jgi:hypothetical protein
MTNIKALTRGMSLLCLLGACSHTTTPPLQPAAKQAVNETRGACPTDLNQSQAAIEPRPDGYALVFQTPDDSQRFALYDRAKALGAVLSAPHPAVNASGQLIQHPGTPSVPELRESPMSPGYGVELVINAPADQRKVLKADLDDHLKMWLAGECPEMTNGQLSASAQHTTRYQDR